MKNTLYDTINITVDTCHHKFVQLHRMYNTKKEPYVNCGLWVIRCECRVFSCNKCMSLVGDVIMGGAMYMWGQGDMEISVPSSEFCCELKTAPGEKEKEN